MPPLLEVRNLAIRFPARGGGEHEAVRDVSLAVGRGEIVALLGESGAGKSLTALAVLGLVPPPGRIAAGSIRLAGRELVGLGEREYRALRGARIGLVPQEPSAALNPVMTVGAQIVEAARAHRDLPRVEARRRAAGLLARLGVDEPEARLRQIPSELSGGQRQRALLAVALAAEPDLLIADEPTGALDARRAAEVLDLLAGLRRERGVAVLLITHDLAAAARICERAVVLHAGEAVESAAIGELLASPVHPHARALVEASAVAAPVGA